VDALSAPTRWLAMTETSQIDFNTLQALEGFHSLFFDLY
jgi:hypothetical protein